MPGLEAPYILVDDDEQPNLDLVVRLFDDDFRILKVYGWNFREAFAWMDAGTRPPRGSVGAGWTLETGVTETLVEITTTPAGGLVGFGARGGVFTRNASGAWSKTADLSSIAPLSDGCFLADGRGFVVGHGKIAGTTDGTTWKVLKAIPDTAQSGFGYTYATTIACAGTRVTAGGVWASATSVDGAATWTPGETGKAFLASVRAGTNGGWLATGYWNYAALSSDGVEFTQVALPGETQWWNDGALLDGGNAVVVGEGGAIAASFDQGATWDLRASPVHEDLYSVVFRGAKGVAVGAHGAVVVTSDGGSTWTARPTGLDGFVGGARFLDDTTFVIAGENGSVLKGTLSP